MLTKRFNGFISLTTMPKHKKKSKSKKEEDEVVSVSQEAVTPISGDLPILRKVCIELHYTIYDHLNYTMFLACSSRSFSATNN